MTRRGIYDVRTVWIAVIVVITLIGTARAQTVVCAHAERGGYDADDGNVFATDYWASEGNLAQVLALRGYLERAGATVELTRTQNRSIDDLPASQVAAIANAANADFFISIDTREQFGTVNYPTTLFRGYDASPAFPEAKAAADTLWRRLLESSEPFGVNYDGANFRGDLSFYSGDPDGSPVLKNLTMPGVESFGSFHDYVPESRRLADDDYQKFRAWTHAVSISRVLDLDPLPGAVAGVARNADKTIADFAIGDDQYAPIEEFVAEIDGYEAVSENNPAGFFFFGSVETDARIVILDAPEFYAATATIDAREDSVVVLAFFPDVDTTSPPTVVDYAPVGRPRNYDIIVEFSDPMNPTATESAFSVAPALTGTFAWENDTTTLVFTPDAYLAGPTDYDVSVSVAAESRYGVALAEPLAFGFETTPPDVLRTEPSSDADSVIVSSVVKIHFDQSMDRQSVEDAFRVTPDVSGAFAWRNESRTLAFAPYAELQGMTTYLVELDTTAASVFNTRLTDTFAFTFDTRDRYCMTTTYTYPLNGQVDVPPTAQFRFRFERPLDFSTLSGAVALYDEFGSEIDVARVNQFDKNDDGYLYFEPAAPLAPGAVHYLVIDESLLDDDGAPLCDAIDYSFATENIVASGGTLAADFESPIYWKDPLLAEGSRDLVESGVALSIDTTREREGYGCLRVSYETESDTAVCVVALKNPVAVGASARFGVSVFGDASGNDLEARFSNGAGAIERRTLARLDWTGWRHVHAAIDDLPAGDWSWESLAIARNAAGADSGVVRFDDAGFDAVVSTNEESGVAIPNDYRLDQNYPNPFNPSTTFAFALPEAGYATLDVFNALGERVAVLFEGEARAGTTTLSRSFVDLPSGVYFYRLRAGEFAKTRKMILLK